MLSIGEFSRVTRITIKALRLYHEKGILIPDRIDRRSKYRYYSDRAVRRATIINELKAMDFSLDEIKQLLLHCREDAEMVEAVRKKRAETRSTLDRYRQIERRLTLFLRSTGPVRRELESGIRRMRIDDCRICSIRFRGRYDEVGDKFRALFRTCGFRVSGPPLSLYYDGEYRESDADIEACVPVNRDCRSDGLTGRVLPGGAALTLLHRGPYSALSGSYQRLFSHCREQELRFKLPIREEYLKGPGLIFRGNAQKYLTRLILLLDI